MAFVLDGGIAQGDRIEKLNCLLENKYRSMAKKERRELLVVARLLKKTCYHDEKGANTGNATSILSLSKLARGNEAIYRGQSGGQACGGILPLQHNRTLDLDGTARLRFNPFPPVCWGQDTADVEYVVF
jgi:hypothetical protein